MGGLWFFMYLVFRCDCGRVLYSKEGVMTRKCTCGKTLKVKDRRILVKVEDVNDVAEVVQELQDNIYHNTDFITADKIK